MTCVPRTQRRQVASFKPSTGRTFGHSHTSVPGWDRAAETPRERGSLQCPEATRAVSIQTASSLQSAGLLCKARLNTSMKAEEAVAGRAFKELTRQRYKTWETEEAWKKRRLKKLPKNSARRASEEASSNGLERTISREPRLKRGDEDSLEGTLRRHLGGWPQRGSGKAALQEDVGMP